ncbi:MAG: malate synthase A [Bdellovibrionales bacterium]|nr:malate synthase A [Bdellovibrionales bacterium]
MEIRTDTVDGHTIEWLKDEASEPLFSKGALRLLVELHLTLQSERDRLLEERKKRQLQFDSGTLPSYLDQSSEKVTGSWKVAPLPEDLLCRRVEITGPVNSAKMVINMLSRNSDGIRADCAMLDFEDSMKPSWRNVVDGVHNVIEAAKGELFFVQPASDGKPEKKYALNPNDMPVVMVRCRGLHLEETNVKIDGTPISAGLLDLALCYLHSADILLSRGKTPKYYVPKVEHFEEARWWNTLFCKLEDRLGHSRSTLRATFLIETLPAAFQLEEILYEIREHAAGLNVGRWDKIFSDIKVLRMHGDRISPDRSQIDMHCEWMRNYALRLIEVCHGRGAFAMGGMAAFTPGKDLETREQQLQKVIQDKRFESCLGHDGCWVSHPFFIGAALEQFGQKNQLDITGVLSNKCPELLPQQIGTRTEQGIRKNVRVGIAYMQGWNHDLGCVAWDDLMEDLATLEISRVQIWQWLHHNASLDDGRLITRELVSTIFNEEFEKIRGELGSEVVKTGEWEKACSDAKELFLQEEFAEFLSTQSPRYQV